MLGSYLISYCKLYKSIRTKSSLVLCTLLWGSLCISVFNGDEVLSILSVGECTKLIGSLNLVVVLLSISSLNVGVSLRPRSAKLPSFCCVVFVLSHRAGHSGLEKLT